jgi:hypothetical protein
MLWKLATGVPWRDLPERYGPWQTCYERFRRWQADATWQRLLVHAQSRSDAVGAVDWEVVVDAAVQGHPPSVRTLDTVGDDQMGVQQRVSLPGCPVVKADRQHALTVHVLDTAMAAAGPQVVVQVVVQVGDRFG